METSANPSGETPIRPTPQNKPTGFLSYANGALKRHYPTAPATSPRSPEVSYKECMKNHAAAMGGHAIDGCCEFMPSPATFNSDDPSSLRCAACGCHRNFHRRDPDDPAPLHRHQPPAPMVVATPSPAAVNNGKKRFRTRFSEEQKEKMKGFSERFGWKMQKIERGVVEEFCNEVGVGREVLKVWMHNHKNSSKLGSSVVHGGNGGGVHDGVHGDVVVSSGDGSSSSSSGFSI